VAKTKPGVFNFGSNSTGTKMTHIPYKGAAQAAIALASGEIDKYAKVIQASRARADWRP
jgi:tripartite-type tricarboxylate transporter receptor subunit TctC